MKNRSSTYEPPFRPPYEFQAAAGWVVGGFVTLLWVPLLHAPVAIALVLAALCFGMAAWRWHTGVPFAAARARLLAVNDLWFIPPVLAAQWYRWSASRGKLWLGEGYELNAASAEKIKTIADRGLAGYMRTTLPGGANGIGWIQQVEPNHPIEMNLKDLDGHTLIVGTTGTGKTRLFDHFISQAIARNEPVIVMDPKGDHDLEQVMRSAYTRAGRPNDFSVFRPARPDESVCLDPLGNWERSTEVASRISALVEADGTFAAFVWRVLNNLIQGEKAINEKPTLLTLRRLVEHGADGLLLQVIKQHLEASEVKPESYMGYINNAKASAKGGELEGYIRYYREAFLRDHPDKASLAVEGLISDVEHNKEHFSKMIVSLTPVLTMLTTPPLDELLSPPPPDAPAPPSHGRPLSPQGNSPKRLIVTLDQIVRQRRGLYMALSSMADPIVGAAIGSIALADLAAYAGTRYDNGITEPVVNLLCDEVAEITNLQLTQILNKGRGARVRAVIATQTLADLTARLGDQSRALQQIGNANNVIILRVQDPDTAELLAKGLPSFKARSIQETLSQSLNGGPTETWHAGLGESVKEELVPLMTPDMLMRLPTLHYVARLADGRTVKARFPIVGSRR